MGENIRRLETSIDIFEERNALRARVADLEQAIARIRGEAEHALQNPERSVLSLCRIDTVARNAIPVPPSSQTRAKPLGR